MFIGIKVQFKLQTGLNPFIVVSKDSIREINMNSLKAGSIYSLKEDYSSTKEMEIRTRVRIYKVIFSDD